MSQYKLTISSKDDDTYKFLKLCYMAMSTLAREVMGKGAAQWYYPNEAMYVIERLASKIQGSEAFNEEIYKELGFR